MRNVSNAHFPVSQVSDAISKVISSVIPPRAYEFLFALIPGLFFEISVHLANPALVYALIARAKDAVGPSHYATLGLALFLAFIIGNAFMFLVLLVQSLLSYPYRLRAIVWEEFCTWALFPLTTRLQGKQWWSGRRTLSDFARYVQNVRMRQLGVDLDQDTRKCWALFAKRLLKDRYGIEAAGLGQDEWNVLYWILGPLTSADIRGSVWVMASEATGWCGFAATLFAPALRNRYYVALSVLLTASGLIHDWRVVGNLTNPRFLGFLKIRALMREFRNVTQREGKRPLPRSAPDADPGSEPEIDGS
jgi:hypothetical protein